MIQIDGIRLYGLYGGYTVSCHHQIIHYNFITILYYGPWNGIHCLFFGAEDGMSSKGSS